MNRDQTYLLALGNLVVNNLLDAVGSRTHSDDDVLGISWAIEVEWTVLAASEGAHLIHILGYDVRNCIVVGIRRFAMSEEYVGILGHTTHLRMLG